MSIIDRERGKLVSECLGGPSLSVSDASDLWCVKELIMVTAHMSHKAQHRELNSESTKEMKYDERKK